MADTTAAATKLRELTEPPALSLAEIARRCGVSREAVRKWALGQAKPDSTNRKILEAVVGIPENDWMDDDERARLEQAGTPKDPGEAA